MSISTLIKCSSNYSSFKFNNCLVCPVQYMIIVFNLFFPQIWVTPGLREWHEKNCSINIREMIICNLYVLVDICVVSTFKIQERRKEHWWETCKFKMYQKQNNHQWLTPSFVTQWYSPPIRKSSNVLDWNLLKCILMGPADSRFRDTELGAPLGPSVLIFSISPGPKL